MPLNKQELEELLNKEEIAYIATASVDGKPHVAPIWFVYREGTIWFETHLPTVKFKNISKNNRISICFGGKNTYIVWGKVEWFEEKDSPVPFRKMLWEKYGKDMDDSYITEKTRIFKVIVEKETSWHYAPTWE